MQPETIVIEHSLQSVLQMRKRTGTYWLAAGVGVVSVLSDERWCDDDYETRFGRSVRDAVVPLYF